MRRWDPVVFQRLSQGVSPEKGALWGLASGEPAWIKLLRVSWVPHSAGILKVLDSAENYAIHLQSSPSSLTINKPSIGILKQFVLSIGKGVVVCVCAGVRARVCVRARARETEYNAPLSPPVPCL